MTDARSGFTYAAPAVRVVFGAGAVRHAPRELDLLGARRVVVLSTPGQQELAETMAARLGDRAAGVFARAAMHVPADVAQDGLDFVRERGADAVVAMGGGSTVGLAKAIALDTGIAILAIPTTYAGSEMTPVYGITCDGVKRTGKDARVQPRAVLYDPELSTQLPVGSSVTSAFNAIAHAVEGLYAEDGNPVTDLMAQEGIRALASAIPALRGRPSDIEVRGQALYGAWLCGTVLGQVGMALHHKLCHALGGSFGLPHAEVHAVVLPHVLAFNAPAIPDALQRIRTALGLDAGASPAAALQRLARESGAPTSLASLGLREGDLDRAAELAVNRPYWNPRPVDAARKDEIRDLLRAALEGRAVA